MLLVILVTLFPQRLFVVGVTGMKGYGVKFMITHHCLSLFFSINLYRAGFIE